MWFYYVKSECYGHAISSSSFHCTCGQDSKAFFCLLIQLPLDILKTCPSFTKPIHRVGRTFRARSLADIHLTLRYPKKYLPLFAHLSRWLIVMLLPLGPLHIFIYISLRFTLNSLQFLPRHLRLAIPSSSLVSTSWTFHRDSLVGHVCAYGNMSRGGRWSAFRGHTHDDGA